MAQKTVLVEVEGVEFEVSGDYQAYTPAVITADPGNSSPAEGGIFENVIIKIGCQEVGEILMVAIFNAVLEAAEAAARGNK